MPDAANSQSTISPVVRSVAGAVSRTLTVTPVASAICEASVRCQISRYSASSWLFSSADSESGERYGVVGRIASWASCALRLLLVLLGRGVQVLRAVLAGDRGAGRVHRLVGEDHVVGTHVGDEAALVEALRDPHHLRRREPQLAAALLLQRRGHERCLRRRPVGLLLDRGDRERRVAEAVGQTAGAGLGRSDDLVGRPSRARRSPCRWRCGRRRRRPAWRRTTGSLAVTRSMSQ